MKKAREFEVLIYVCFIDLKRAYDSVNCEVLCLSRDTIFQSI